MSALPKCEAGPALRCLIVWMIPDRRSQDD